MDSFSVFSSSKSSIYCLIIKKIRPSLILTMTVLVFQVSCIVIDFTGNGGSIGETSDAWTFHDYLSGKSNKATVSSSFISSKITSIFINMTHFNTSQILEE